jgi:hypothetical protein
MKRVRKHKRTAEQSIYKNIRIELEKLKNELLKRNLHPYKLYDKYT